MQAIYHDKINNNNFQVYIFLLYFCEADLWVEQMKKSHVAKKHFLTFYVT
jgi:hypothetical protein